jgi:hypothetical protein
MRPVASKELTTGEALTELKALMRLMAAEGSPQRLAATTYTNCREALLQSELRPALPGFLLQCLTIFRFKDFIQLYAPNLDDRIAFVDEAFRACEARAGLRPTFDVFGDPDF